MADCTLCGHPLPCGCCTCTWPVLQPGGEYYLGRLWSSSCPRHRRYDPMLGDRIGKSMIKMRERRAQADR